jgi:putative oxidoreductase
MNRPENNITNTGLLFLRVGIGIAFMTIHGGPKIFGGPERWRMVGNAVNYFGIDFFPGVWGLLASIAEFGGGLLILLGFFFRPALSMMIITMFVAAFQHLAKGDGIFRAAYPMEMAVVLIALFIMGPGKYSLAYYIDKRQKKIELSK